MNDSPTPLERRLLDEHQTLALPLKAVLRRPPVTCGPDVRVADAAATMRGERIGCIVVVDGDGVPVGIFTERDLVSVAADRGLERPVGEVMTVSPLALAASAPAYEAALAMLARGFRRVLVTEGGALAGVVSERDLFSLQRLGLGEIALEIRLAADLPALVGLAARVRRLTRMLVSQGVGAQQLMLFISMLNDRVSERVIQLAALHHPIADVPWCWLAFGSEGRLEQLFATDQDNGLIFALPPGHSPDAVRARVLPFAREVNEGLDACGFPLCRGNVMASNPALCLSTDEWHDRMRRWLGDSEPQALLDAAICFDFRGLAGRIDLAEALRDWFLHAMRSHPSFLRLMAGNALQAKPALGRWGRDFATDDAADAPATIDLKQHGIRPFVDAARIMAFARALAPTNTAERLRAVSDSGGLPAAEASAMIHALGFIQALRGRHQASLEVLDESHANRIDPHSLDGFERRALKDAFRVARDLQARLALDFQL